MRSHIISSQILALNRARYHVQQIARFLMSDPTSLRLHEKLRITTVKVRREKKVSYEITHYQFTNSGTKPGTLSCSADRALSNELSDIAVTSRKTTDHNSDPKFSGEDGLK